MAKSDVDQAVREVLATIQRVSDSGGMTQEQDRALVHGLVLALHVKLDAIVQEMVADERPRLRAQYKRRKRARPKVAR
jgi:hypothetical protein